MQADYQDCGKLASVETYLNFTLLFLNIFKTSSPIIFSHNSKRFTLPANCQQC
jgi:hypothetical protein